jgi:hypothetical protein
MTITPETVIDPELPTEAWIIIEEPRREPVILAGTEAASQQALTHWKAQE